MTAYEAIQRIQTHNAIHSRKEPNAVHITEALQMAVSVLEKQVPQKVINHGYLYGYACECPVCKKFVTNQSGIRGNYCYNCGQALDWGEVPQ